VSKPALLGGKPVTQNLLQTTQLKFRPDLERKYLLETYDGGVWDDWPHQHGSMTEKFRREWAAFNGSKYCELVTNGTHSMQLALEALEIGAGDEVIVPGLTWQATASCVCDVNAVPVLVDVDPETFCINPEKVEEAITRRTRAIIPVHLYNRMADMDRLLRIARKHKLHVIEDTAHAHGSLWDGRSAGTLGDFGSFSFQRSKLMNSGEGGALLMQKKDWFLRTQSLRACGRAFQRGIHVHSGNFRMTGFQAAILRGQLQALKRNAPVLHRNGLALDRAVADAPGVRPPRRDPHLTRQCGYCFAFLYDQATFDDLDAALFRRALSAELGVSFIPTYVPLSHSELYTPHTKKRHQLSAGYVRAITPSRWKLPVADALWKGQAVVALWQIYGCPPARAGLLTDAIAKIYEHRHELAKSHN
jgi:L-glutamine:2-deoxy-scyllo-inosose/3-amino-2,3-dideoxy-scyllo-inosose aminotransferase